MEGTRKERGIARKPRTKPKSTYTEKAVSREKNGERALVTYFWWEPFVRSNICHAAHSRGAVDKRSGPVRRGEYEFLAKVEQEKRIKEARS